MVRNNAGYQVRGGPESGSIIVRKDGKSESWVPVERFDRNLGNTELSNKFGFWKDKEIKRGFIFKETVRGRDGRIQDDEVKTFRDAKDVARMTDLEKPEPTYLTRNHFEISLEETSQGTLVMLQENWREYPR